MSACVVCDLEGIELTSYLLLSVVMRSYHYTSGRMVLDKAISACVVYDLEGIQLTSCLRMAIVLKYYHFTSGRVVLIGF